MPPGGSSRILVVEDDSAIRQLLIWMLEDRGFTVDSAANGRQAIEHAAAQPPALVILDMGLPFLDGVRVSSYLRDMGDDTPRIIVVSADREAARKAAAIGAVCVIEKPFDIDELMRAVDGALTPA